MSHASASVHLPDGTVLYGEENDTSGMHMPLLFKTRAERDAAWRDHDFDKCCYWVGSDCDIVIAKVLWCEMEDMDFEADVCVTHCCYTRLADDDELPGAGRAEEGK